MRDFLLYTVILIISLAAASFAPSGSASNVKPKTTYRIRKIKAAPDLDADSLRRDLDAVESRCAHLEQLLEHPPITRMPLK